MNMLSKSLSLFALVTLVSPLASARQYKTADWSVTLKYSNATSETFDAPVLTLRGRAVYADDGAYCVLKIANGIEMPCTTQDRWGTMIAVVSVATVRSLAENTIGRLSGVQQRVLDIFELGLENQFRAKHIGILLAHGPYPYPQVMQFHDPASNHESVHWVTNTPANVRR